jgi:hypothetical protein
VMMAAARGIPNCLISEIQCERAEELHTQKHCNTSCNNGVANSTIVVVVANNTYVEDRKWRKEDDLQD